MCARARALPAGQPPGGNDLTSLVSDTCQESQGKSTDRSGVFALPCEALRINPRTRYPASLRNESEFLQEGKIFKTHIGVLRRRRLP